MNVLDYLVKPVSFQRFAMAMDKFFERKKTTHATDHAGQPEFLQVRADRKFLRIPIDGILYIEGVKDYVRIVTTTDKVMTKISIGHIIDQLPADRFLQVHKSFIVAKNKITGFTAQDVMLGAIEIPIGRSYKDEVMKVLGG
jgi:DNA-binding LytR/AlgR family response regulator